MSPASPPLILLPLALLLAACGGAPPTTPSPVPATPVPPPQDTAAPVIDEDGDGYPADVDCDDNDPYAYPGAVFQALSEGESELGLRCRDYDLDCDGLYEGQEDVDGDGFSWCDQDCDDLDPHRFPGAPDPIDGVDRNCDGTDGVGEAPTLLEIGTLYNAGLGFSLRTADVNGDGCDDLVITQSGLYRFPSGQPGADPLIHAWIGCTNPTEVHTLESLGAPELGRALWPWHRGDRDLMVAATSLSRQRIEVIDFASDPPTVVYDLDFLNDTPFGFGNTQSMAVVHREQVELVAGKLNTVEKGPGRAWTFPLDGIDLTQPDRLWWGELSDIDFGWASKSYDRDGDGLEELLTNSTWYVPLEAQGGKLWVLSGPGLDDPLEVWHGDFSQGGFFGESVFPAPDLPHRDDHSLLAGSVSLLDSGALYILPYLGPGEHTLDEAGTLFLGEFQDDWFGISADVGDVNADGHPDVVIGAPGSVDWTDPQIGTPGMVYVFLGPITEPVLSMKDARVFVGTEPSEFFGYSVELADLDGDGTPEIYVGAPSHTDMSLTVTNRPHNGAVYRLDL